MGTVIGVDPHKASHTAAAVAADGTVRSELQVAATRQGLRALRRWAEQWPDRTWGIEGASGLGRSLAQHLVGAGERVVDVPAKFSARVRTLSTGHGRKSDAADAVSTALAAIHRRRLTEVGAEDHSTVLRLLSDRRDDLVRERTRLLNRLHVLLRDLRPGGAPRNLSASKAAGLLRGLRPRDEVSLTRKELARELVADVRRLDGRIQRVGERIATVVRASGTPLLEIFGVGPIPAAHILGQVGTIARFEAAAQFASYTGTAPIEASSSDVVRHRLSRAGNRKLNHALHLMAICQIRHATPGRTYYLKKRAEGKSDKEALRCLKRRLSDVVFRQLRRDLSWVA